MGAGHEQRTEPGRGRAGTGGHPAQAAAGHRPGHDPGVVPVGGRGPDGGPRRRGRLPGAAGDPRVRGPDRRRDHRPRLRAAGGRRRPPGHAGLRRGGTGARRGRPRADAAAPGDHARQPDRRVAMTTPRFDELIHSPTRLAIVSLLAASEWADFSYIRDTVTLSDSALSKQLTTLEQAGYVEIRKGFIGKRPRTSARLTTQGRAAFEQHVAALQKIVLRSGVTILPG